jgi:two-component system response regulator FixJ
MDLPCVCSELTTTFGAFADRGDIAGAMNPFDGGPEARNLPNRSVAPLIGASAARGEWVGGGAPIASEATVYIVDDDEDVRNSLSLLVESVHQPVNAFASAQEFLRGWDGEHGGVLVLDIRLPEMSGLALQERLMESSALMPIIFITAYGDVPTAVRAMRDGAFDFIEKPFRSQDLLEAIQRALSTFARAWEDRRRQQRELEHLGQLTDREYQILEMLIEGKPNKVMAADLGLSQRTVEVHRASLMKKMEADSLAGLVRAYLLARGGDRAIRPIRHRRRRHADPESMRDSRAVGH